MEYLQNSELLIAIFGLVALIIAFFAYKSIIKTKGINSDPIIDETFEQTKDVLVEKIKDEIQETKEEIKKKRNSKKVKDETSNNINADANSK